MADFFPDSISVTEAIKLQEKFADSVILEDLFPLDIKTIGGAVVSSRGNYIHASVCIFEVDEALDNFELKEQEVVSERSLFPSVPTFEGFREGKLIAKTFKRLGLPKMIIIDGAGINHPRRFGLASHVGVALDTSALGVSRALHSGKITKMSGREIILNNEDVVGEVVRNNGTALYVSPGHKITLETAVRITQKTRKKKIPEPLRIAQENLIEKLAQKSEEK